MLRQYMLYIISHSEFDFPKPMPEFHQTPNEAFDAMVRKVSVEAGISRNEIIHKITSYGAYDEKDSFVCPSFAFTGAKTNPEKHIEWIIYGVECDSYGKLQADWGSPLEVEKHLKARLISCHSDKSVQIDRNYTDAELNEIVKDSIELQTNMLRYYCRDNLHECRSAIKRHIRAIKENDIIPEKYWHGNIKEFEWFLVLLSDGYPGKPILLNLAKKKTNGEIKRLADHYYQHINVMFDYVQAYAGYVVLQPTEYMLALYPEYKDILFVYTQNKWSHNQLSDIDGVFMVISSSQLHILPELIKKKIRCL